MREEALKVNSKLSDVNKELSEQNRTVSRSGT